MTSFDEGALPTMPPPAAGQASEASPAFEAELNRLIESLSGESAQGREAGDETASALYLILSSKQGLTGKYGELGFRQLDRDLRELGQSIEEGADMETSIIYVDDAASVAPHGFRPVDPTNPWQIKRLIDNLDARLVEQGREIRYILIVGGDRVIPFHRLPNPIDDQDSDVPSDNPYASRDANYLIPERAVGRMPGEERGGISLLHGLIQAAIAEHSRRATPKGFLDGIRARLWPGDPAQSNGQGMGYTASIWRKASRAVFRTIGDDRQLRTSPPITYQEFRIAGQPHFSYFNLHGVEDGGNWYGQRDGLFPADYPLFPVALRPQDLVDDQCARSIVFTEACYGANVLGKSADDAIALRFLASRALTLVGSTKISYGAIEPPLLGADLMGRYFWEGLRARLSVGDALKYAKVSLAREMQDRQGYLDGEDQKALISFVLYGDPSLPAEAIRAEQAAGLSSKLLCPPLICQKRAGVQKALVSDQLIATVKGRVETSLPHMAHARVRATQMTVCHGECGDRCGLAHGSAGRAKGYAGNWSFTLEKDIPVTGEGAHRQVVKITTDGQGHILKLAVSK